MDKSIESNDQSEVHKPNIKYKAVQTNEVLLD